MAISIGTTIYDLANLPGQGKSGGSNAPTVDLISNNFSMKFNSVDQTGFVTNHIPYSVTAATATYSASFWMYVPAAGDSNAYAEPGNGVDNNFYFVIVSSPSNAGTIGFVAYIKRNRVNANPYPWETKMSCYGYTSDTGGTVGNQVGANLPLGAWYHFVVTFEGRTSRGGNRDKTCFYLNGNPTPYLEVYNVAGTLYPMRAIGEGFTASNGYTSVNGNLDEVALFDYILTVDDIKVIYDATNDNPGKTADLSTLSTGAPTAWYRMGD